MVVLQSMWNGPNHYWNWMESGSESATYVFLAILNQGVNHIYLIVDFEYFLLFVCFNEMKEIHQEYKKI